MNSAENFSKLLLLCMFLWEEIELTHVYRKVPIVTTPESNVKSLWLLINPENSEPPKVASPPKVARPSFFNCVIHIPNAFIVFQSIIKFLMYNTNIFVH